MQRATRIGGKGERASAARRRSGAARRRAVRARRGVVGARTSRGNERVDAADLYDCELRAESRRAGRHRGVPHRAAQHLL